MEESMKEIKVRDSKSPTPVKITPKKPTSCGVIKKPKYTDMSSKKRAKLQEFIKISREIH